MNLATCTRAGAMGLLAAAFILGGNAFAEEVLQAEQTLPEPQIISKGLAGNIYITDVNGVEHDLQSVATPLQPGQHNLNVGMVYSVNGIVQKKLGVVGFSAEEGRVYEVKGAVIDNKARFWVLERTSDTLVADYQE